MPYVVAALVAGILLIAEQHWRQRLWFRFDAAAWWMARVVVECAFALALTAALLSVPKELISLNAIILGVVAGLAAPRAFGRAQISIKERNFNPVNLAYERATQTLNDFIDESSAEAQRCYVDDVIRPAAQDGQLNATDIAEAFRQHLGGRRLMGEVDRTKRLAFIKEIQEDTISNDEKVALLVLKAWEIGAYKALQGLLKPLPRRRYGAMDTMRSGLKRLRITRS